jgi:hypothetical protein
MTVHREFTEAQLLAEGYGLVDRVYPCPQCGQPLQPFRLGTVYIHAFRLVKKVFPSGSGEKIYRRHSDDDCRARRK